MCINGGKKRAEYGRLDSRVNEAPTSPLISLVVVSQQLNNDIDFESLVVHLFGLFERGRITMKDESLP
jgi:hypothetical protein